MKEPSHSETSCLNLQAAFNAACSEAKHACPAVSCSNYEPEGQVSILLLLFLLFLLLLLLLLLSLGWFDRESVLNFKRTSSCSGRLATEATLEVGQKSGERWTI